MQKLHNDITDEKKTTEAKVHVRDKEISRLQCLYEGGQNLDQLNVKHVSNVNKNTLEKL